MKGEKDIRKMKIEAKSDGVVTTAEKQAINNKLKEQNKEIYQEKHDGDKK